MKFLRALPLLASLLAVPFLTAAGTFEGRVALAFKADREKEVAVSYAIKQGLVRLDAQMPEAGGAAMIFDWAKKEMTVLMPQQSMYMTMPLDAGQAVAKAMNENAAKVERTGKTETILGYVCEQLIVQDKNGATEVWVTDKLGAFMGLGGGNPMQGMMGGRGAKPAANGWEEVLKNLGAVFPLRVTARDAKGKATFTLETKSVEPGPLPDSLFVPPPGYQKFAMPNLGGMLRGN